MPDQPEDSQSEVHPDNGHICKACDSVVALGLHFEERGFCPSNGLIYLFTLSI